MFKLRKYLFNLCEHTFDHELRPSCHVAVDPQHAEAPLKYPKYNVDRTLPTQKTGTLILGLGLGLIGFWACGGETPPPLFIIT